jgi:galactokinase
MPDNIESSIKEKAIAEFTRQFGTQPAFIAQAPGRVNLIGEHTDYNGGHVLPMAVDRHIAIAASSAAGANTRIWSDRSQSMSEFKVASSSGSWQLESWARYVAGTATLLSWEGIQLSEIDAVIISDLPSDAGLSSSAALEVASALAFLAVAGASEQLKMERIARICQKAEHKFAGVKCGIMDQYSVACCQPGSAVYLNCANMRAKQIVLPPELAVLVVDSCVQRKLADAAYNQRRADCEAAADILSSQLGRRVALAEVSHSELARFGRKTLNPQQMMRARHVVGEELRTSRAVEYLKKGDLEGFGDMARDSHRSLAEDFEVSCPELDKLVALACDLEDVYGARLTGAGFGGAAVVFCAAQSAESVGSQLRDLYKIETGFETKVIKVQPVAGAAIEKL